MKLRSAALAAVFLGAVGVATPAFAQSTMCPQGNTVATQQLQVTARHPDRMVGGQGMPVVGAAFTHVRSNSADLRNLHPGYRGFISDGN